ncbi:Transposase, Mutator family [compost metagenome]
MYQAATLEGAEQALADFEERQLGKRYAIVAQAWRRAWDRVIPFSAFIPPIRRVIYTTNAIESINA